MRKYVIIYYVLLEGYDISAAADDAVSANSADQCSLHILHPCIIFLLRRIGA